MPRRAPRPQRRVGSTRDSILLHDIRNLESRLTLLLSNMEEHYGDPDFKNSATDLLKATVQKLDGIATMWSAHREAVLIKVPLGLNDLVKEVVRTCRPRRTVRAADDREFRGGSRDLGRSLLPARGDPERGPERAGSRGELRDGPDVARAARCAGLRRRRGRGRRPGHVPRVRAAAALPAVPDDEARGCRARPLYGAPHPPPPPRRRRGEERGRRGHARPALSRPFQPRAAGGCRRGRGPEGGGKGDSPSSRTIRSCSTSSSGRSRRGSRATPPATPLEGLKLAELEPDVYLLDLRLPPSGRRRRGSASCRPSGSASRTPPS